MQVRRGNGDHSQNPEVSSRKIFLLHKCFLFASFSSSAGAVISEHHFSIPSYLLYFLLSSSSSLLFPLPFLPLLYSLSISLWSPRRLCPHSNRDFLCVGGNSVLLSIAGHLELQASETGTGCLSPIQDLERFAYMSPPFIPEAAHGSFQEVLLHSFLHPNVLFPTIGYTQMIYWASSVTCLWFLYTRWGTFCTPQWKALGR